MLHAIAIDDEPPALRIISNFCSKIEGITLDKTFTGVNDALRHLRNFPVDILFLDIQMPSVTGIEFHKMIDPAVQVIFTTAHSEFAVKGFELKAADYLLKPFTFDRFDQAVTRVKELLSLKAKSENGSRTLFVRADYSLVKINVADIQFIEGLDDYLRIHMNTGKPVVVRMTMKAIAEKLPESEFVRVHRSFIVPVSGIKYIRNKSVFLESREIPIGGSFEAGLDRLLQK